MEVVLVAKIFLCPSNRCEHAVALIKTSAINTDVESLPCGRVQAPVSKKGHQAYRLLLPYVTPLVSLCCFFQVRTAP